MNNIKLKQLKELTKIDENTQFYNISILANISSFLFETGSNLNWVGFYFLEKDNLYLGPFQGQVACTKISVSTGVCGKCIRESKTIYVSNVHEFSGHIACDNRSNSELVIPIYNKKELYGVLDIDSYKLDNFTSDDIEYYENVANIISNSLK